jgi:energy-coupling factor transporter ATP-binding protein EcfA2
MAGHNPADNADTEEHPNCEKENIYWPFMLPVKYLEKEKQHELSNIVVNDLELANTNYEGESENPDKKYMYDFLFQPQTEFGKDMIHDWKQIYTTDTTFLKETQDILVDMQTHRDIIAKPSCSKEECDAVIEIWKEVKEDEMFLEKYSYIEWQSVKYLNESPEFLQTLSVLNMTSPVLSFIIPFLFLLFPFIILKIQNIPITFTVYLTKLKELAQHHMLGRALANLQSISMENLSYLIITLGLYCLQMYQNTILCMRFYNNITKINNYLCTIRTYIENATDRMRHFTKLHIGKTTYRDFCMKTNHYCDELDIFHKELHSIKPFSPSIMKVGEIGYLLKCFYRLHGNLAYEDAMRYSFGFMGYLENIYGVVENLENGHISLSTFSTNCPTQMKNEYYPPLKDNNPIKNDCNLKENMIITGPNGSGKTTMLKTTMINIIFSQQVGSGFYDSCTIHPYTHIFSYLNIPDTSSYDSLFQAESRRCKVILDSIQEHGEGYRHFYIFDELFSGTSPTQAEKLIYHYLSFISKFENVDFCITSHHIKACKRLRKNKRIKNYKMIVEQDNNYMLKYNYNMKPGISLVEGSISVIKQMNYPEEIINDITQELGSK